MQRKEAKLAMVSNFNTEQKQHHDHSDYVKLTPEMIFSLLDNASGRVKTEATKLLARLATTKWYVLSSVHEGGSVSNAPLHITLRAPNGVHLNCKKNFDKTLYVYEITER